MIYLDMASLGSSEELAVARCKQLGLSGALIPRDWRYQVLLQAGNEDTIICGPRGIPFWSKLPARARLINVASSENVVTVRAATWLEWALTLTGLPQTEAKNLVANPPKTERHGQSSRYNAAASLAFVVGGLTVTPLPPFEQLESRGSIEANERPYSYTYVKDDEMRVKVAQLLDSRPTVGLDVETDMVLDHPNETMDKLVGLALAFEGECYYGDDEAWFELIRNYANNLHWVGHNSKYDRSVCRRHGILLPPAVGDSMLAAYLLGVQEAGLKQLVLDRYGVRMITYAEVVGKGKSRKPISSIDSQQVTEYCCGDAYWGLRMERDLVAELDTQRVAIYKSDLRVADILVAMQKDGVPLDRRGARSELTKLKEMEAHLVTIIDQMAQGSGFTLPATTWVCRGCRNGSKKRLSCDQCGGQGKFNERTHFNPGSNNQIVAWLHDHLRVPVLRLTDKGGPSADALALLKLREYHAAPQLLLMYKNASKYIGYLESWLKWSEPDSKLHSVFSMTRTATGRHSSQDPNVQQIKLDWRKHIVAPEGRQFIAADYGQIEVRIPAFVSRDPALVRAMTAPSGTYLGDIHGQNVQAIFGIQYADQGDYPQLRTRAKNYLFGALYGSKGFEIQTVLEKQILEDEMLDVEVPTLKEIMSGIDTIHQTYPVYFKEWVPSAIYHCRERRGWGYTLFGRPGYYPEIFSKDKALREHAERQLISLIIQGTAGDIIRFAEQRVSEYIGGYDDMTLHLTVHDELVLSADYAEVHAPHIATVMELDQPFMPIPLVVDVKIGGTWEECHK